MTTTLPTSLGVAPTPTDGEKPRLLRRLIRGRQTDPAWVRPALLALLGATALLYLWDLGASGWANSFYSAAVQAGTKSWKAFFFGSSDAANSITVDKPPASLWVMEISARIFGVNSWSILVPQALEGVAAVAFLYATVRRWFTPEAALLAGAVMAITPSAVLMFRFNNPDALLILLLTVAAYGVTRAIETGRTGWLLLVSSLIGFGFLTKMMQAFLVVPGFAVAYLVAARTTFLTRLAQLAMAAVSMVVSAGWWVAIVTLIPAADRPYIGGSQHNSILELIFGYNGFGRLTGNETGSVTGGGGGGGGAAPGGGQGGGSMWGKTGWARLFGSDMGTQVSWLLPAALTLLVGTVWLARRSARTDRLRAAMLVWGGWLLVTGTTFSLAKGIIHPYYTAALAPAIGAVVGIGGAQLWRRRDLLASRLFLAAAVALSGWWAHELLARTPAFDGWLRPVVLVAALAAAALILVPIVAWRRLTLAVAGVAIVAAVAAPTAYALDTASTPHTGSIPTAGPASAGFGGPGGMPNRTGGGFAGPRGNTGITGNTGNTGTRPNGAPQGQGGAGGAGGSLLDGSTPSAEVVSTLSADASSYTWVAAAIGSNSASGYQLATGDPVMPIGGFNGSDPSPTLAQFEQDVAQHKIHYLIAGGIGASNGGSSIPTTIEQWVQSHFSSTTVGGITLYDLTKPTSSTGSSSASSAVTS
jgi:4-amino-4-deoxy-L-arabinose transferase-like glycosyltransferase